MNNLEKNTNVLPGTTSPGQQIQTRIITGNTLKGILAAHLSDKRQLRKFKQRKKSAYKNIADGFSLIIAYQPATIRQIR